MRVKYNTDLIKQCKDCRQTLPTTEFYRKLKVKTLKSGETVMYDYPREKCKACCIEESKQRYHVSKPVPSNMPVPRSLIDHVVSKGSRYADSGVYHIKVIDDIVEQAQTHHPDSISVQRLIKAVQQLRQDVVHTRAHIAWLDADEEEEL